MPIVLKILILLTSVCGCAVLREPAPASFVDLRIGNRAKPFRRSMAEGMAISQSTPNGRCGSLTASVDEHMKKKLS